MKSILATVVTAFLFLAMLANSGLVYAQTAAPARAQAVFAGGCFWCLEHDMEEVPGVISAESGYTGGRTANPTYRTYVDGGHVEAVRVIYDPARVTYAQLVDYFFRHIDPTDAGGQFCDRGHAYSSAIFAVNDAQRDVAENARHVLARRLSVATRVEGLDRFWPAEEYHQDYANKNPLRYRFYRLNCGRDARVREVWSRALQ